MNEMREMREQLRLHEHFDILTNGQPFKAIEWRDPETGILCGITPRLYSPKTKTIYHFRVVKRDESKAGLFKKKVLEQRYNVYAAFSIDGMFHAKRDNIKFVFILYILKSY